MADSGLGIKKSLLIVYCKFLIEVDCNLLQNDRSMKLIDKMKAKQISENHLDQCDQRSIINLANNYSQHINKKSKKSRLGRCKRQLMSLLKNLNSFPDQSE